MTIHVQNFKVINQFDISDGHKHVFQSYNSTIFVKEDHTIRVGKHFDYSKTTSKYAKLWLSENTVEDTEKLWKFLKKQQDFSLASENKSLEFEGYTIIFDRYL